MMYLVEIQYRELSYETRNGPRPEPYRASFRINANCERHAIALAIAEFRRLAVESAVGWTRDIVGVNAAIVLSTPTLTQ